MSDTSLVVIKNKLHGSTHTVTAAEWAAMQKKGHGLRIFKVISETKIEPQPKPRNLNLVVPPEVQEIVAKRTSPVEVIEVGPNADEVEEVRAGARKKPGRKPKTGTATATEGAKADA